MIKNKVNDKWTISELWNDLLTTQREIKPRDYIYASEIGQPFLDRYLKMKGTPYSNPFDPRTLRVFDCGHIFEEEVMVRIFKLLGIFISSQKRLVYQEEGLLPVVGKHDPKIGGIINIEQSDKEINRKDEETGEYHYSDWIRSRAIALRESLIQKYPNGMRILTSEIKSVNSNAFWSHKNQDPITGFFKGYDHHKLQLFNYLMSENEEEGRIFYISKDDLTLMEAPVYRNDDSLYKLWRQDVAIMTDLYNKGVEPEAEEYIFYNPDKQKYEINWAILRSNYFTYITGWKDKKEWENYMRKVIAEKNRAQCPGCEKEFSLSTLEKYGGYCKRCFDKNEI